MSKKLTVRPRLDGRFDVTLGGPWEPEQHVLTPEELYDFVMKYLEHHTWTPGPSTRGRFGGGPG